VKLARTVHFHPALFQVLPLINVLFLVLALFALSSRFVLQPGISVSPPVSSFTLGPQQNSEIVSVTSAPVPTIYFRDRQVSLEELIEQLSNAKVDQRSLIVKADRQTSYDLVMQITNLGLKQGYSVVLASSPNPP
jgi:biopolymer transport protein ExbD